MLDYGRDSRLTFDREDQVCIDRTLITAEERSHLAQIQFGQAKPAHAAVVKA